MISANSVMREIWSNMEGASGQLVTVDRNFLYTLLLKLEHEQYEHGHSDGHRHMLEYEERERQKDRRFENCTKW